jgi:hypothetical protein
LRQIPKNEKNLALQLLCNIAVQDAARSEPLRVAAAHLEFQEEAPEPLAEPDRVMLHFAGFSFSSSANSLRRLSTTGASAPFLRTLKARRSSKYSFCVKVQLGEDEGVVSGILHSRHARQGKQVGGKSIERCSCLEPNVRPVTRRP